MSNVLGKRKFAIVIATVLSVALLGAASLASADPSCPSIFSACVLTDGFDTDADNWSNYRNAQITWLSSKYFADTGGAEGVIQLDNGTANAMSIGKDVYFEQGSYRLQMNFTADYEILTSYYVVEIINFQTGQQVDMWDSREGPIPFVTGSYYANFMTLTTEEMFILTPGLYKIVVRVNDITYPFYINEIIIGRVNSNLTPGAPTYTPAPTGIPQSTPMPTPSAVECYDNDDADLVPSAQRFAYFYDAGGVLNVPSPYWSRNDTRVTSSFIDYPGSGKFSVLLPNSTNTTTIDARAAWILSPTSQIANTYYIHAQAQAISASVGITQYIQVYAKDAGVWALVDEIPASSWYWYELNFTDTSPSAVTNIAFVARRSDGSTSEGGVVLDQVYVYGHEYLKPRCDGQWWSMQDGALTLLGSSSPGSTTIMIPSDRECPPNIDEANNFWGPLISSLTLFTDQLFALAPAHIPGNMRIIGQNLIESPIPAFVRLFSVLFDLRVPMTLIGIGLAMESARVIIVVFQMLKKTIPFL